MTRAVELEVLYAVSFMDKIYCFWPGVSYDHISQEAGQFRDLAWKYFNFGLIISLRNQ